MKMLAEPSVEVRRSVVRSLGWLEVKAAYPAIRGLLADSDAGVRQTSLRALEHIDPDQTRTLPELGQLTSDPDPAVARKAAAIQR
jgi:HEAT repeat protein